MPKIRIRNRPVYSINLEHTNKYIYITAFVFLIIISAYICLQCILENLCVHEAHHLFGCLRTHRIIWCVHEHTKYKRGVGMPHIMWVVFNDNIITVASKDLFAPALYYVTSAP